jgi:methyltransferase (TIGR00027 family)
MSNNSVEQKPSETALFAALRRAIAYKDYQNQKFGPDNLAESFLPFHFRFFLRFNRVRENTKDRLEGFLPGLNAYMIARTAYFDGLFLKALKDSIPQIVLLGAGYDTRAYRYAKFNQGTRIFELDIAPTQNRKSKCLKKARINVPQEVKLVPIDFNRESLKEVLEIAGYDDRQKTLFIWEGVSYYLEAESVDATLAFVHQAGHPDSAIALDYTIPITQENVDGFFGTEAFEKTMKEHHGSEALLFSIDDQQIESFFTHRGMKIMDHLDNEEIERNFLTDQGELIGRITGHFRFVMASPS